MVVKQTVGYFRSVVEEGKKVVWPTRQTVIKHTVMVVAVVAVAAAIFASIDFGFQQLVVQTITR